MVNFWGKSWKGDIPSENWKVTLICKGSESSERMGDIQVVMLLTPFFSRSIGAGNYGPLGPYEREG